MDPEEIDSDDAWFDTQTHYDRHKRFGVRPKTLKSVINRVMAKKGYGHQQTNNQIAEAWSEVVPDGLGGMTRVAQVRRGVLEIYVNNPMVLQQMGFLQRDLLKKLQQRLKDTPIKSLRFKLG